MILRTLILSVSATVENVSDSSEVNEEKRVSKSWADDTKKNTESKMNERSIEPNWVGKNLKFNSCPPEKRNKLWEDTLIGYFTDRSLPSHIVKQMAEIMWKAYGLSEVIAVGDGFFFFFFFFGTKANVEHVKQNGSWTMFKQYIHLKEGIQ